MTIFSNIAKLGGLHPSRTSDQGLRHIPWYFSSTKQNIISLSCQS